MKAFRVIFHRYGDEFFWLTFCLLNFALWLPLFLFFRADASFWPSLEGDWQTVLHSLLWQRENGDIFRLHVEFVLLVTLWVLWPRLRRQWLFWLFFALYLLQLAYAAYEGFVRSYYMLEPVLYNDVVLFGDGASYVWQSLNLSTAVYLQVAVALAGALVLLWGLHWLLLRGVVPSRRSKVALAALMALAVGFVAISSGAAGSTQTAVSSFTLRVVQNAARSYQAYERVQRFDGRYLAPFFQFTHSNLAQKPNIYIIFIESYGSVLYQRPDFRVRYGRLLHGLETQLAQAGWQAASSRSLSPTWGGGSWIAYTSFLTGLQVESHAHYLRLFQRYQEESLPHLFNYLQTQGYGRYQLSANADEISDEVWQRYRQFYGVDTWLRFRDLAYSGPLYGWGPSPPDQYALHFAANWLRETAVAPYVFFFITQNSHYPWVPLPPLLEDWRTLNDAPAPTPPAQPMPHGELRRHYATAIEYELQMLTQFILQEGSDHDIFILVGDHQPARVARYTDGWDTPIHVISRDAAFVRAFHEYNFVPGLATDTVEATLHHAGFYTLLMRVLLQQYGTEGAILPDYLPQGVQ